MRVSAKRYWELKEELFQYILYTAQEGPQKKRIIAMYSMCSAADSSRGQAAPRRKREARERTLISIKSKVSEIPNALVRCRVH